MSDIPSTSPIHVVLVDDHPVFLIGMAALLQSLDTIEVTGQAESVATGRELFSGPLLADVVLMDVDLWATARGPSSRERSCGLDRGPRC